MRETGAHMAAAKREGGRACKSPMPQQEGGSSTGILSDCLFEPRPSAAIDAPARPLDSSNALMYFGLSYSCDFQENMGQTLIAARAGALHVSVACMRVRMASAQGTRPAATITCSTDTACVPEAPLKETSHKLLLAGCSSAAFATEAAKKMVATAIAKRRRMAEGVRRTARSAAPGASTGGAEP
jgi:hypothetical protein